MVPLFPIGLDFSLISLRFHKRLHLRDSIPLQPGLTLGRRDNGVLCSPLFLGEQGCPVGRPQMKIVTGSDFQIEVSAAEGVPVPTSPQCGVPYQKMARRVLNPVTVFPSATLGDMA